MNVTRPSSALIKNSKASKGLTIAMVMKAKKKLDKMTIPCALCKRKVPATERMGGYVAIKDRGFWWLCKSCYKAIDIPEAG